MINLLLCFPDGYSVVPFLRSLISAMSYHLALVLTFPKYLCSALRRLDSHCRPYSILQSLTQQLLQEGSRVCVKGLWLFISLYCIFYTATQVE